MTDATQRTVHVAITGRVQGVGFRYWTLDAAQSRGLDGWVRNRQDGVVEALFAGPADKVEDMLVACRRGPRFSAVAKVEVTASTAPARPGFEIRR